MHVSVYVYDIDIYMVKLRQVYLIKTVGKKIEQFRDMIAG